MKKTLLLFCIILLMTIGKMHAQDCSVFISSDSCTYSAITAKATGGNLSSLTWFQYTNNVFAADTISSQGGIHLAAGGNGVGSSSDQFGFPSGGIAVDIAGNVYIADVQNNRIQKWYKGGTSGYVTVAGGNEPGNAPNQLFHPQDVFVDSNFNIYVADYGNHRIQKFTPNAVNGITVAGGNGVGSAANQLNYPSGVYVDKQGNIFIADTYNYRIQTWKPNASSGVTVAGGNGFGTEANQFSKPVDVYLDAARNIYVADADDEDASTHRVQKWKIGDSAGVTVAGGNGEGSNANQFGFLLSIYVDAAGNVYATDNGVSGSPISRVQKWVAGSNVGITVAGGHVNGWDVLSYPTGVALDRDGLMYVMDGTTNPRVQSYVLTKGFVDHKFTPTQYGPYYAQAVFKGGCTAVSNTVEVAVNPGNIRIRSEEAEGYSNLCGGVTAKFFIFFSTPNTTYAWKLPDGCTMLENLNDTVVIATPPDFSSGNLSANGRNVCTTGTAGYLTLTSWPVVPGNIGGPTSVSPNQKGIVYAVRVKTVSHNWTVPAGAVIQSGQGTNSIIVDWGTSAGIVSVNSYNDCGASVQTKQIQVSLNSSFAGNDQHISAYTLNKNDLAVFPNPVKNIAILKFTSSKQITCFVEIKDMTGKLLMQKNIIAKQGSNTFDIDVSKYAAGLYIIDIKNAEKNLNTRFIKQ